MIFFDYIKYRFSNILKYNRSLIGSGALINARKTYDRIKNIRQTELKIFSQYCAKEKKHLIQSSGTLVNGSQEYYSHKASLLPENDYGKSKLKAEKFILKSKCKYTILRFGGIYGKNGPQHLGINKFIKDAFKGKTLKFKGNPYSKRNYVFVSDAAKILIKC